MESVSSGVTVGVQYLGEVVVSWTDVVGVKGWCQGVRDAKESVDLRGVGCELLSRFVSSFLQE